MYEMEQASDYPGYDGPTVENGFLESDLPTRDESEWASRLVARNDLLTEAEASQVSAIVRAYVNGDLMTRAEWEEKT